MSLTKDVEVLRNILLFAKVEPDQTEAAGVHQRTLEYMSGDELFRQGDYGDAAYIILEGEADVLVDTPKAVKVATLGKNDIIGEIAVLCDVPRTAMGRAARSRPCVSKDGFFHLVTQFPQVAIEVMSEIASRLHHTTQARPRRAPGSMRWTSATAAAEPPAGMASRGARHE